MISVPFFTLQPKTFRIDKGVESWSNKKFKRFFLNFYGVKIKKKWLQKFYSDWQYTCMLVCLTDWLILRERNPRIIRLQPVSQPTNQIASILLKLGENLNLRWVMYDSMVLCVCLFEWWIIWTNNNKLIESNRLDKNRVGLIKTN